MGTHIHFDEMLPATDAAARGTPGARRELEVLIPSGTNTIHVRIGHLNNENGGDDAYEVKLERTALRKFIDALEGATVSLGQFLK